MVLYFLQTFQYYIFTRRCIFLFYILGPLSTPLAALIIGSLLVRTDNKDIVDKSLRQTNKPESSTICR